MCQPYATNNQYDKKRDQANNGFSITMMAGNSGNNGKA
jgi:hypothetical protein